MYSKEYRREYMRKYRKENAEKIREYEKKRLQTEKGKESKKKSQKKWYEAHKNEPEFKEKQKARCAKWRHDNRYRLSAYYAEYRKKKREREAANERAD